MTVLNTPDSPKALREALCAAQSALGARAADRADLGTLQARLDALQRLINECDRHRPLGQDGKHGERHTPTCGCEPSVRADSEPPVELWLGLTRGQWPIQSFSEDVHAMDWLAQSPQERRLWKVVLTTVYEAEYVPPGHGVLRPKGAR